MNRIVALGFLLLAGCAGTTPPTMVHQPMTARPVVQNAQAGNGAIFQAGGMRPLFEDRRARMVGDTITINLVENSNAAKKSSSSADRTSSMNASVPTVSGLPGKTFQGMSLSASDAMKFAGDGASAANNTFTGTITVTVIEALPNGNLLVSGEKKLAINEGGDEFIRFSGVVNPATITTANTVQSVQVADARLEYKQNGYIDSAQVMGWLSRFFLSALPF
ncbi:MAG: flagellar basal body L-ring protein FlgH [Rhodocyclaceae bacterium]|nr:flagellar basal body L-ring protein FlgH [Rhodocyclaceae bacterium]